MEIKSYIGKEVFLLAEGMRDEGCESDGSPDVFETVAPNCGKAEVLANLKRTDELYTYDRMNGRVLLVPVVEDVNFTGKVVGLPHEDEGVVLIVTPAVARLSNRRDLYTVHDVIEETDKMLRCRSLGGHYANVRC